MTNSGGATRTAVGTATDELDRVLDGASGEDRTQLGEELFAVGDLLGREITLRRALTDSSRPTAQRTEIAGALFASRVSPTTLSVLATLVAQRWSRPRDLVDTVDDLAVRALVAAAQSSDGLDNLEDEVFRFRRILAGDHALRTALANRGLPAQNKSALLDALLGGRVGPSSRRLIGRAVERAQTESIDTALERYGRIAAARRERLVASVHSAVELTGEQRERLASALHRLYGRDVVINVEMDPSVLGGLAVQVGDEVIDGTVLARLEDARRQLAR